MRIVLIAAECEPWAKTGGLGDVVDALARALGSVPGIDGPVEVFLPRYRSVPVPADARPGHIGLRVPDPWAAGGDGSSDGATAVSIVEVAADGYRLRLVDHPAAFERATFYGGPDGDYPDNAWRFGLFCRAALETLRADGRPVDVISLHDWQAAPALVLRDLRYADDPILGPAAFTTTLHNLAYHGWTPAETVPQLGLAAAESTRVWDAAGIDLLGVAAERAELTNTVSPTYAAEAVTPAYGMGLDPILARKGDRFLGILNGLDTALWDPAADPVLAAPFAHGRLGGLRVGPCHRPDEPQDREPDQRQAGHQQSHAHQGQHRLEVVERHFALHRSRAFGLNCQGFLDSCRWVQLTVLEQVLQMQRDVLLGGVEQLRHLRLRQPHRLAISPQLDPAAPVFGGVEDQLTHGPPSF